MHSLNLSEIKQMQYSYVRLLSTTTQQSLLFAFSGIDSLEMIKFDFAWSKFVCFVPVHVLLHEHR